MSEGRGKKRSKSFYLKSSHAKRVKYNSLGIGTKGFFVTCNNTVKQAVAESYNILNEYADLLYGPEKTSDESKMSSEDEGNEEEDMEEAMQKEIKAMREKGKSKSGQRRFKNVMCAANNCLFISTNLDDPVELHAKIFSDLFETKIQKARFALRMLPIIGTCKVTLDELMKLAEKVLPKYFLPGKGNEVDYSVNVKCRNNNSLGRSIVLPNVCSIIKGLNPLNRVNCEKPDINVFIEIICNVCCLGVGRDFQKYRKYNFQEIVKNVTIKTDGKTDVDNGANCEERNVSKSLVDKVKSDAIEKPNVIERSEKTIETSGDTKLDDSKEIKTVTTKTDGKTDLDNGANCEERNMSKSLVDEDISDAIEKPNESKSVSERSEKTIETAGDTKLDDSKETKTVATKTDEKTDEDNGANCEERNVSKSLVDEDISDAIEKPIVIERSEKTKETSGDTKLDDSKGSKPIATKTDDEMEVANGAN